MLLFNYNVKLFPDSVSAVAALKHNIGANLSKEPLLIVKLEDMGISQVNRTLNKTL